MLQMLFQELEKKIQIILEKYDSIKKENEEKESRLLKINREITEAKKQIEVLIKERETIKKRIASIVEKIDSSGLL